MPELIGGDLNLNSLTTAEGLFLPESIVGNIIVNSSITRILKEKYPQYKNKFSLFKDYNYVD